MKSNHLDAYGSILSQFATEGRLRAIPREPDTPLIDLCSNDYLGLGASSRELAAEFVDSSPSLLFSSSASRLLSLHQEEYRLLEEELGSLYGRPALLFNSGYHANCGAISALATPGTAVIADRLAHASMIDGLILSRAPFERFRHNDLDHLCRLLGKHASAPRILLILESIYSMDGDLAPLGEIVKLKERYPQLIIYLDEAHAFGVRGERGLGLAEELGLLQEIDIIVGTFGKAAASSGAFIAAKEPLRSFLLNSARSFIFSTAIPPVCAAFTRFLLPRITSMTESRKRLAALSSTFAAALSEASGKQSPSASQIVPWIIGDAERTAHISEALREAGFLALPIRRPTVPPGTERIRFSLNASLDKADLSRLVSVIHNLSCV